MMPITIVAPAVRSNPPAVLCGARPRALLAAICGASSSGGPPRFGFHHLMLAASGRDGRGHPPPPVEDRWPYRASTGCASVRRRDPGVLCPQPIVAGLAASG